MPKIDWSKVEEKRPTIEQVKEAVSLEAYCSDKLERCGRTYVCPACGSGHGSHKTPAFSIKGERWKCFSCDKGGDIFDLAGIVCGTDDKAEQLQAVAEWAGIDGERRTERPTEAGKTKVAAAEATDGGDYSEGRERHRAYVAECVARMRDHADQYPEAVAYLEGRGLQGLGLGYDPARRRIVIPWAGCDWYHIDRDITGTAPNKYDKPKADDVGKQPLWNRAALTSPAYFVVEGALDALAVQAAGGEAVALGGTGCNAFMTALAEEHGTGVPILMLDADGAGRAAEQELSKRLDEADVWHLSGGWNTSELSGPFYAAKDPDEARKSNPAEFSELVARLQDEAEAHVEKAKREAYLEALARSGVRLRDPAEVAQDVYLLKDAVEPVPTGMQAVDKALDGGLYGAGLVVLGAVSSVGKTTMCVQWADNMAASGRPVLFVSIEQSAGEIVSRSLSRIMSQYRRADKKRMVASAARIMNAHHRAMWATDDPEKERALQLACGAYSATIAPRLQIVESSKRPNVATIRTIAEHMAEEHGAVPVVFVDYLQLLAPASDRMNERQAVEDNVTALRVMAKELGTCVVAISSLNRASYNGAVSMESFKESGGVEYSADQLLALQPARMAEEAGEGETAAEKKKGKVVWREFKQTPEVEVELVVLKNRSGAVSPPVTLTYNKITNDMR